MSAPIFVLVVDIRSEWRELDQRTDALNSEIASKARDNEAARRLLSIPGVGVLGATALIAAVGDRTPDGSRR